MLKPLFQLGASGADVATRALLLYLSTMSTTRRQFLAGAAAVASGLNAGPSRPPNIVFILLDDLGYGDFGCYGQKLIRTPNVDRAAAEGRRFTDCYAGAAVCGPSRSALMTGLHNGHGPIRANAGTPPIAASDFTVAQALKKAGYTTGGFGKWGLGDAGSTGAPTRHGFDEFFGYLHQVHAHSYYPEFLWDNDRKFPLPGNAGGKRGQYTADIIAERSFEFLRKSKDKPFFLYASYTLPHAKFEIPSVEPYGKEPWTDGQKTYAAMVTRADRYIGRILAMLKQYNRERETVVFITSDNGASYGVQDKGFSLFKSNGPLRGQKGELYEGGIRVPMIVRWPGMVQAGSESDFPWAFWDFMPTAAEIAGVPAPEGLDGISVMPAILGTGEPKREFLYWEFPTIDRKTGKQRPGAMPQAVRTGEWKAIREKPGAPLELYNLSNDIGEKDNVAAANPTVVKRVEEYLKTARTEPRLHNQGSMRWVQ